MPEGDAIHRAARRLQPLVGQQVAAESPNPRGRVTRVAERIDGRRLEAVEAVGKNLVLRFEGGVAVLSHLRMSGRWTVRPKGSHPSGSPWLVLAGDTVEAVLWNGPVLQLHLRRLDRLGPDILERPLRLDTILDRLGSSDASRTLGETLLDQGLVAGIGNMWMAETLWAVGLSPWRRLSETTERERRAAVEEAAGSMSRALEHGRAPLRSVYRRAGRPCPRCGARIASRGQGEHNRIAYWCPTCQT